MTIATADIKHGLKVTLDGSDTVWDLLDRAPRAAHWWLHRWEGDIWHTTEAHPRNMTAAQELSAPLTRTDKWKKGPFEVHSNASPNGRHRVQGHVVGVWGVHRNESKQWVLTHLPTGYSVPTNAMLKTYSPVAADMRRAAEHLAGQTFTLDAGEFGIMPDRAAMQDLKDAVSHPLPSLVGA